MKKMLRILLAFLLFLTPVAVANSGDNMTDAMRALFLSANGRHDEAAETFARLGKILKDANLMRDASQEAWRAKMPEAALKYARQWEDFGGGKAALNWQTAILLWQERYHRAELILAKLAGQATDEELFELLRRAPDKQQAAAIGNRQLSQTVEGRLFVVNLALVAEEWALAESAIAEGLKRGGKEIDFYLLRARLAGLSARNSAPALAQLEKYRDSGCAGWADGCTEASLVHAYRLFSEGNVNWRQPLLEAVVVASESALQTGQFFESLGMLVRAERYYEKISSQFFHARLGLVRISRNNGNFQEALDILNKSAVANDHEFMLREMTAANLLEEMEGVKASYDRIVAARRTSPENPDLLYSQSLLAESIGDIDGALDTLREMTRLHPQRADGWNALGYVMADHNRNLETAEKYIKRALSIDSNDRNILDSMGWVLYRQGKLLKALNFLQQAAAKGSPPPTEIAAHLGEVHWMLGNKHQAQRIFEEAAVREPDNSVLNETIKRLGI
ncbi:tetratricopeptide repeat protein [Candidatus Persebacteraceae bacterium Df01]|jgi:tetratricopeptide (TPR) repeat protein|uniref:Tetratricopeptide repeat protein n=1 Tax=Candidatus Doriopsillibacter californiensis TaxID=2970740 RepID=A0ABT7QKH1_9GAMM|nr:tetratricopeptide repeat protein [Candidatus Persebacteraceae bacterium Df01]